MYHGKDKWNIKQFREYFVELDKKFYRFIPGFDYLLTDLSKYSDEEIKGKVFDKVSLEIALLVMRNIFNESELESNLKDFFEIGRQYFEEEEGLRFLESVIRYLYSSTEIEVSKVVSTIKEISEKGGEISMTTAAKLIEKGKIEGRIEGEKALLIRLIKSKWGALSPDIKACLSKINSPEELEALGEKVIGCECIEDLFPDE